MAARKAYVRDVRILKKNIPFLTPTERAQFRAMRAKGAISVFRTTTCKRSGCTEEIPKVDDKTGVFVKTCCSRQCWDIYEKERAANEQEDEDDDG